MRPVSHGFSSLQPVEYAVYFLYRKSKEHSKLNYQQDEHRVYLIGYHLIWCPKRRKRLLRSKKRQLKKIKQQIKDIEHKQTTQLITTLYEQGVQTVVIGDVRHIRQGSDVGHTNNQKIHQWSHGSVRFKLTYKAERLGMAVALQDEHYTSRTCPYCGHIRSKVKGRVFRCPKCGWTYHRDGVGSINIRQKYLGQLPVVGVMAPPTGLRFRPHTRVARRQLREAVLLQ